MYYRGKIKDVTLMGDTHLRIDTRLGSAII